MATPSPPKPWERSGGATSASVGLTSTATAPSTSPAASSSSPPPLPELPNALNSVANRNATNYSTMNANRYGSPYGGGYGAGMSSYSSPYSRMGGGYGSMYGGGMGGMYGGMGGMGMGMGGMYGGGMYGGMGGMPGDPNNMSLTQSFSQSTQTTFQLIEGIVGAFGGFAQMLESTYMATHSSFFAMVSVAEQFGNLRQTLGSVLGIFTLMRWIRTAIAKLTGRPLPAAAGELTPASFAAFNGRAPDGSPAAPKPSKKPFIMFMLAVFGLPYLMGKLIRTLARSQEEEEKRRMAENPQAFGEPLDPSKLEFRRVLWDFTPDNNAAVQGLDLAVKKGDAVAIMSKSDPMGNASEWWRCRSRDGKYGYLPALYLGPIQRKTAQITAGSPAGSRAQTMTSSAAASATGSRTATMTAQPVTIAPEVDGKAGDMGVESFQKGAFYS